VTLLNRNREIQELNEKGEALKDIQFNIEATFQTSDSGIREQYHKLCCVIDDWVETEFPDLENVLSTMEQQLSFLPEFTPVLDQFWESEEHHVMRTAAASEHSILKRFIWLCLEL